MARPDEPASVYLDSNALIYAVTKKAGYEPVAEVLRLADAGKLKLYISALSYVEVRGWPRTDPYPADLDTLGVALLDSASFIRVEFHRRIALVARRYAYTHRLGNYDAIHLASAVEADAEVFMTWDRELLRVQMVDGTWIAEPFVPGPQPSLFDA